MSKFEWPVGLAAAELGVIGHIEKGGKNLNADGNVLPVGVDAESTSAPLSKVDPPSDVVAMSRAGAGGSTAPAAPEVSGEARPHMGEPRFTLVMDGGSSGNRYYVFETTAAGDSVRQRMGS